VIAVGGPRQPAATGPGGLEIWDLRAVERAVITAELPRWGN